MKVATYYAITKLIKEIEFHTIYVQFYVLFQKNTQYHFRIFLTKCQRFLRFHQVYFNRKYIEEVGF
jgi:hypothetical protein